MASAFKVDLADLRAAIELLVKSDAPFKSHNIGQFVADNKTEPFSFIPGNQEDFAGAYRQDSLLKLAARVVDEVDDVDVCTFRSWLFEFNQFLKEDPGMTLLQDFLRYESAEAVPNDGSTFEEVAYHFCLSHLQNEFVPWVEYEISSSTWERMREEGFDCSASKLWWLKYMHFLYGDKLRHLATPTVYFALLLCFLKHAVRRSAARETF